MCVCDKLNETEEVTSTRRKIFLQWYSLIQSQPENAAELYQCKDCGQHWYVEAGKGERDHRPDMAFKIPSSNNWLEFDTVTAVADWYVEKHGGLSKNICWKRGCQRHALLEDLYCPFHTYLFRS